MGAYSRLGANSRFGAYSNKYGISKSKVRYQALIAFVLCISLQNDKRICIYSKALSQKHPMAGWGFDARYLISLVLYKSHKNGHEG